jgi:excisionase family DNA binding protein
VSDYASDDHGPTPERCLTARQLANILNVHENYIYELAARGLIPSYKIGGNRRFRWSEIETWLDQNEPAPTRNSSRPRWATPP